MKIYKVESKEDYDKIHQMLSGIAFFRFDPVDGYLIKVFTKHANMLTEMGFKLTQITTS